MSVIRDRVREAARATRGRSIAVALTTVAVAAVYAPAGQAQLIQAFDGGAFEQDGSAATQAASHPHIASTRIDFRTESRQQPSGGFVDVPVANPKDLTVELPAGFVGDPSATPRCTTAQLGAEVISQVPQAEKCPPETQVGILRFQFPQPSVPIVANVYNLVPPPGEPALFGISAQFLGTQLFYGSVRSDGDYGINVGVRPLSQAATVIWSEFTFWGVPSDPSHDDDRGRESTAGSVSCADPTTEPCATPSGAQRKPLLTLPTSCVGPVETRLTTNTWQAPTVYESASFVSHETGDPSALVGTEGCEKVPFDPSLTMSPHSRVVGEPSGYTFDLRIPQTRNPDGLEQAHLNRAVVTLPGGVVMNPSAADGLAACSDAQVGLRSKAPSQCPEASKIGKATVTTSLLENPLEGDIYLGTQEPGERYRIFLVIRGPGVIVKLKGVVSPNPETGQLTTTFDQNPQLPFDHMQLEIKGGSRAPLANLGECGTKTMTSAMTPWTGNPPVMLSDSFAIDQGCGDPNAFDPTLSAGSTNPVAGKYSPFALRMTRDGGKDLGSVNLTLPRGSLAALKHVAVCGEPALATVAGKSGNATRAASVCPVASQVGTVTVGAGAGSAPFYPALPGSTASGRVFLAGTQDSLQCVGGKRQTSYGLAIEVPAAAGPFDLGTVLVRAAICLDPKTGEATVMSGRMPRILDGVPLNVRDIRVLTDRGGFTTTPTSCAEKRVEGDIVAQDGTVASRSSRYQVSDCAALRYKPRLAMRLTGKRQRTTGKHPGVRAVVRQTGVGEAGIEKAVVRLPKSLALDPDNAQALCEFEDGTKPDLENRCPSGSIIGRARAFSPLLKRSLAGNAYFVKNVRIDKDTGNEIRTLPMIVVALRGEVAINLIGKSSTTRAGRLVNTFAEVPDAPISRFNLNIAGGADGILAVTRTRRARIDLCDKPRSHVAETVMDGQNGKRRQFNVRMKTPCGKAARAAGHGREK